MQTFNIWVNYTYKTKQGKEVDASGFFTVNALDEFHAKNKVINSVSDDLPNLPYDMEWRIV